MNNKNEHHDLLTEVLAEAESVGFRDALLDSTLRRVRRRRRLRRGVPLVGAVAMLATVAMLVTHFGSSETPNARITAKGYELVATRPFAAERIVTTQPFDRGHLVVSVATVSTVHTPLGGTGIRLLDDRQLLALAGDSHPAVLVRIGPQAQRLVFVKSEDQNGFSLP